MSAATSRAANGRMRRRLGGMRSITGASQGEETLRPKQQYGHEEEEGVRVHVPRRQVAAAERLDQTEQEATGQCAADRSHAGEDDDDERLQGDGRSHGRLDR